MSPSTRRRYPLTMICQVWRVARSTVYGSSSPSAPPGPAQKRGPKPGVGDEVLVAAIRTVLAETPFHGEGYRKVRARLAHRGLAVSGKRVLRLMRQHQLLAPRRLGPPNGDPAHAGTIITTRPNEMWGTDATRFYTEQGGWCWFFGAIDHYSDDLVGWHVAKLRDRWAALEPLRQGAREIFGAFHKDIARGVKIRCDWGPQYIAGAWITEVQWLGMTITLCHRLILGPPGVIAERGTSSRGARPTGGLMSGRGGQGEARTRPPRPAFPASLRTPVMLAMLSLRFNNMWSSLTHSTN